MMPISSIRGTLPHTVIRWRNFTGNKRWKCNPQ